MPIPGSKNKERIIENLDAALVDLSDEEFAVLTREAVAASDVPEGDGTGGAEDADSDGSPAAPCVEPWLAGAPPATPARAAAAPATAAPFTKSLRLMSMRRILYAPSV